MAETISDLVEQLGKHLEQRRARIALAESCTGGMVASALVAHAGFGGALERSMVVYSNEAKCDLLGLDRERVEECDGVSEDVARAMARAALERSRAELALAITGFAGPQEKDEEVGLVHIASASHWGAELYVKKHFGAPGRNKVRQLASEEALRLAIVTLQTDPVEE